MKELRDRVAVITGGASGIGRATAERLAAEGMRLVLADVEQDPLGAAAAEIESSGTDVLPVVADVSDPEQVEALARRSLDRFGAVHVVFNNAGVVATGGLWELPLDELRWVVDVNLWGVIHGIRSFVPILLDQGIEGHIVNTASMAGLTSAPFLTIYSITKHAVVTLSESLYKELQILGSPVRVSVVCPGLIKTRIMEAGRNRPSDPHRDPPRAELSVGQAMMDKALRDGIESGMEPAVVADRICEAIREEQFYVIPSQPEVKLGLRQRIDELAAERNPSLQGGIIE